MKKSKRIVLPQTSASWSLYIVQCADTSLYTGITTDISRRIKEHNTKKGAFYTKNKTPVTLVYQEPMANQSEARKREAAIKRLTRAEKIEFLNAKGLDSVKLILTGASEPITIGKIE